ncbi:MAG: hypothetical protein CR988_05805 [Treponema sp.]|nr:MAG: hypothetical protein CR988_05805 [Treponema sp.]
MSTVAIVLLIFNLLSFPVFYFVLRKKFSRNNYVNNMKKEVDKLIRDIEFHSERCVTLIDDRIATTQNLLKEVDNHINIAGKELKSQKKEVVMLEKLMDKNTEKIRKKNKEKNEIQDYSETLRSKGINPDNVKLALKSKKERVIEMHKDGISKDAIAKKIGIPFGEVELIITLNS